MKLSLPGMGAFSLAGLDAPPLGLTFREKGIASSLGCICRGPALSASVFSIAWGALCNQILILEENSPI